MPIGTPLTITPPLPPIYKEALLLKDLRYKRLCTQKRFDFTIF